ncbi:hypothetical protein A7J08_10390 (plasmid) [Streptococcus suis]|uniref:Uncharacterized protein n=2 Tax=Streptococcus suis TaxID=1307 RepID=A0ACD4UI67_STRSU
MKRRAIDFVGSPVSRYSTDSSGGKMDLSISFRTSTKMTSIKHNNRDLTDKEFQESAHRHINQDLSKDNLYVKQENLKQVYDKLFGEALQDYNTKQRRKDRKIDDFYHHVKQSKTLDLQREFIVGLGSKADWDKMTREEKLQAGEKLAEYVKEFSDRHSHLYVYNAAVHLDEAGAPHAHFNVVPVGTGYKNGLKVKPSFKKALANEGYKDNGRTLLKNFKDREVKELEQKLIELGHQRKEVGTNDIKDLHEYKKIVAQATKDLEQKLIKDYGAPEYINETTGEFYDLIEYHNFTEFPREENEGQIARKTTTQEKINWVESQIEERFDDKYFEEYGQLHDLENKKFVMETMTIHQLESDVEEKKEKVKQIDLELNEKSEQTNKLSERLKKQKEGYEKNKSVLQKQREKIKELAKYDVQDYPNWRESRKLVEELEKSSPKLFSGNFLFSGDFVNRLKAFVTTVVDKLDKVVGQNNLLKRTIEESELKKQELEKRNQNLFSYAKELETENKKLKGENEGLRGSKKLLEDIQDVITDKEVNSLNKRLEELRKAREASQRRYEPRQSKGRSI